MNKDKLISIINNPKPVSIVGYTEQMANTWLCSHVLFFKVECDANDYSREDVLAWIFSRNKTGIKLPYIDDWQKLLTNITISPYSLDKLKLKIDSCNHEILNSEYIISPSKLPICVEELDDVKSVYFIDNLQLYDYGPGSVILWEKDCQFYYLEHHRES